MFVLYSFTQPGTNLYPYLALWPLPHTQFWQPLSYAFLHGGYFHLGFNMFGLWMFGRVVEQQLGVSRYLGYYTVCVLGAALLHLVAGAIAGGHTNFTVGASGGVLGVVLAFGVMFPDAKMVVFPIPLPVKAKWAILGFVVVSVALGITDTAPGIAHFAHLGGMLFGWMMLRYWRRPRRPT
jgi:membrane associated rhomboid family serine protease